MVFSGGWMLNTSRIPKIKRRGIGQGMRVKMPVQVVESKRGGEIRCGFV